MGFYIKKKNVHKSLHLSSFCYLYIYVTEVLVPYPTPTPH